MGWLIKLRICFWVQKMLHNTNISCQIRRSKEQPNQTLLMFKMKKKKKKCQRKFKANPKPFLQIIFCNYSKKKKKKQQIRRVFLKLKK